MPKAKDLTGHVFGKLTVKEEVGRIRGGITWLCQCECGNTVVVPTNSLKYGNTQSCGCFRKRRLIESTTKHGQAGSRIYSIYQNMISRCTNPNRHVYYRYGGRGIGISESWLNSFLVFYEDMKEGYTEHLTLDRIDVNGNYCKENCRWTTNAMQQKNKRDNRLLSYKGEVKILTDWAKEYSINDCTLFHRIKRGWSMEEALTRPLIPRVQNLKNANNKRILT